MYTKYSDDHNKQKSNKIIKSTKLRKYSSVYKSKTITNK